MEMNISKTYSETISKNYQTWKYTTTLTKTVEVKSTLDLKKESEKLWKQVQGLTQIDIDTDQRRRETILNALS